jgi:molybdenum cofactor cytidylyltransferase
MIYDGFRSFCRFPFEFGESKIKVHMKVKKIYAVILAAGVSRRLGTNKLTLRIDGQTVIRRSVTPFLTEGIEKTFVVVSINREKIERELEGLGPLEVVDNPHYQEGMSSSVKAVLTHVKGADGVFFHLGDKPFVKPEQVKAMLDLYLGGGGNLLVPRYEGGKGHPVLMTTEPYFGEMENLGGDKGLREIIEKHLEDVVFLEGDEGNVFDIDTVEDIETLKRRGHKIEES